MLGVVLVSACSTESSISEANAPEPFTRGELYSFIAGKTQVRADGGAYYADDGKLLVVDEKGNVQKGSWSTTQDGKLCWHFFDLKNALCEAYFHRDGKNYFQKNGNLDAVPETQDGNTLKYKEAVAGNHRKGAKTDNGSHDFFSREQTIALLSGKTSKRAANGRMYYAPDYTLKTVWNGVHKTGTWSVNLSGGVCWHIVGWEKTPCEYYFLKNDRVWAKFRKLESLAAPLVDGDLTDGM